MHVISTIFVAQRRISMDDGMGDLFCGGVKLYKRFRFREVINMLVVEEIYTSPALLCRQSDKTQENFTIFGFYSLSLTTTTTYLYLTETAGTLQVTKA